MHIRRSIAILVSAVALFGSALSVLAQMPPGPPKVLQIYREEIKPGKGAAHAIVEAGWPRALTKANWPTNYLAAVAITGPSEAWFMTGYDSYAAWETDSRNYDKNPALKKELDQLEAKDGELRSGGRSMVASLREDLSKDATVDLPKMRYFRIITFRVRPGHEGQFADGVKIVQAGYDKAKLPAHWAVYQLTGGMPGPTFFVFAPMKSLAEIDDSLGSSRTLMEAEGEDGVKKLATIGSEAFVSTESNIFEFNPTMSYPSKEWVAADPDFWKPKAAPAMKSESKKPAAKAAPKAQTP
ncbi:MAG: hypothetical protein M3P29_01025 [Acidobacteriota bacterium]|nr:hypothetical protein [Acidobacteriota bacterium]